MKRIFQHTGFIVLFLLVGLSSKSQKKYLFELEKPEYSNPNLDFYIGEIIDDRNDTSNVGWVYKGIFNKPVPSSLRGGILNGLKSFFEVLSPDLPHKEKINLRLVALSVSEKPSFPEQAVCSYRCIFENEKGKALYKVSIRESRKGFDATGFHSKLINKVLSKSTELFMLNRKTYSAYVPFHKTKNLENKILGSKKLQKGFYASFEELQANNPSIRPNFDLIKNQSKSNSAEISIELHDKQIDKNKLLNLVWGFSDGKNVYIKSPTTKARFSFNILKNIGRYAHFIDSTIRANKPPTSVIMEDEQEFVMDMKTGRIWSFNQTTLQKILVQDPKIYKVYTQQPSERKELLKDFWLEQFNQRYAEKIRPK